MQSITSRLAVKHTHMRTTYLLVLADLCIVGVDSVDSLAEQLPL